jgi:hypothetical protein
MKDAADSELLDLPDMDAETWNEYAIAQGWSDGMPLYLPTEEKVARFVAVARGDNEPFPPLSPSNLIPTLPGLAANAVMAGARPEYFPAVLAALRGVLQPEYNLHGTLATTHPCAPMVMVSGPIRHQLGINCGSNCFGQGNRANASIGRALELILLNIGGAKPGEMDRATHGSPAKYTYCFGENQEESPWEAYHVRRGFASGESVVTVMAGEPPHNINDHGSTSAEGLITTMAGAMAQPGSNNIYGKGPLILVIGPEHAATLARDGWKLPDLQKELWQRSRVHVSRIAKENLQSYADSGHQPINDHLHISPTPEDMHIVVAGGPGKHSVWIPSFGGTAVISTRIRHAD